MSQPRDDDRTAGVPFASVIIVNTNELQHLERCLPSVHNQSYPSYEVIVVDNDSTDGSVEFIHEHFPRTRVIESKTNLGYPGANNLGFNHARGSYLAVLNPDTMVDVHWLSELVRALETTPEAGLATSKIMLMDAPGVINACGNVVSLAGLTFCRGVGEPETAFTRQETVPAVSGAAFLVRREVIDAIGPFDDAFVAYLEETDLSLRARLAGWSCIFVPGSRAFHQYSFRFSEWKCFHIEKNRFAMLYKVFRRRTLALLTPVLLFTELMVWGYMCMKGRRFIVQKAKSYAWLVRNREYLRSRRAEVQQLRQVTDRELLQTFIPQFIFQQMVHSRVATVLDRTTRPILSGLSNIVLRFVA